MEELEQRAKKIFGATDADVILLPKGPLPYCNFFYATGLNEGLFDGSIALLDRDAGITLFINALEDSGAVRAASTALAIERVHGAADMMVKIRECTKGMAVGFDGSALPYNSYLHLKAGVKAARMVDASKAFDEARSVKGEEEISRIRRAVGITRHAFSQISGSFKPGLRETELAEEFDSMVTSEGAATSFETIVAFGKNSAVPHHVPGKTRLKQNSFVLIDAGARYRGYCSDLTRTYIFKPEKSTASCRRMSDMRAAVVLAQQVALDAARAGAYTDEVHRAAEELIGRCSNGAYKGRFIHGLGHSIGIDVHDSEHWALAPRCHRKLKEFMVFSNEPGIYIEGFGGVRIEDDILIKKNRAVML